MEKITEGKNNWFEQDEQAWNDAVKKLRNSGWIQEPDKYRNTTFHKDGQIVALVRNLGKLNWHPVDIDVIHADPDPLVVGR